MMRAGIVLLSLFLAACGTQAPRPSAGRGEPMPGAVPPARPAGSTLGVPTFRAEPGKPPGYTLKHGGGFYQDDGPGVNPPPDLDAIPDAVPRAEPLHRFANNPYSVLGQDYVPQQAAQPYRAQGIGSWYGRKFHGQKTSSGELYDMYGMTAAHPTLPIPSYARVSNPGNGKSVVVRVNDRGPFLHGRLIDLSYAAAWKLGYVNEGSSPVVVERVFPGQETLIAQASGSEADAAIDDPILRFAQADELVQPAKPLPPLPSTHDAGGHYLQLGAFGNRDNAEALRARLSRELGELAGKLVIRSTGALHRVQLGPWADAGAARGAAEFLQRSLELLPVVVPR